ncbi:chalcone isomerase family protein [Polaromonas sp. DSR2-3-2]|uniref:chalcone isomerase family protein n=1 Tax=unclassified Polaromonas TaxID=2638319 RepID=UPI003CF68CF9
MKRALPVGLAALLWASAALAQLSAPPATPELAASRAGAPPARPELSALPQARLVGQTRLTLWGFDIYDVRLWAPDNFSAASFASSALALELNYLRNFQAADIAERSLKEMRRSQPVSDAQAAQWKAELLRVIPDVRKGDRITGVHRPGVSAAFWVNGRASGEILDADFARLFFGIWLSPGTSEPRMREALLAGSSP